MARTAYTGKWHLDGSGYFGDSRPGGGFEPDWWYDGKRYAEDIPRSPNYNAPLDGKPQLQHVHGQCHDDDEP